MVVPAVNGFSVNPSNLPSRKSRFRQATFPPSIFLRAASNPATQKDRSVLGSHSWNIFTLVFAVNATSYRISTMSLGVPGIPWCPLSIFACFYYLLRCPRALD